MRRFLFDLPLALRRPQTFGIEIEHPASTWCAGWRMLLSRQYREPQNKCHSLRRVRVVHAMFSPFLGPGELSPFRSYPILKPRRRFGYGAPPQSTGNKSRPAALGAGP